MPPPPSPTWACSARALASAWSRTFSRVRASRGARRAPAGALPRPSDGPPSGSKRGRGGGWERGMRRRARRASRGKATLIPEGAPLCSATSQSPLEGGHGEFGGGGRPRPAARARHAARGCRRGRRRVGSPAVGGRPRAPADTSSSRAGVEGRAGTGRAETSRPRHSAAPPRGAAASPRHDRPTPPGLALRRAGRAGGRRCGRRRGRVQGQGA